MLNLRLPPALLEPFLSADAVLLGGSLRRAVRNYAGGDPERRKNGLIPVGAAGSVARGLWRERTIRPESFVRPCDVPRFIGGTTGRSGTTWLMDLFREKLSDTHVVVREIGLFDLAQFRGAAYEYYQYANLPMRDVYRRYFRYFILSRAFFIRRRLDGTMLGLCDLLPRRAVRIALDHLDLSLDSSRSLPEIEQSFGRFYTWLYNCHAELVGGGRPWMSKEPPYARNADQLLRMIPAARLVVLVRDGRDVALSMHDHGWHPTVRESINRWRHFTELTAAALDRCPAGQVLLVRYHDLVHDFDRQLDTICGFLDVPRPDTTAIGGEKLIGPRASSIGRWKRQMVDEDRAYFAETCSGLMDRFGLDV